jgi:hypothetical protein
MQHRLPRELRDMIYAQLWDPEMLDESHERMIDAIEEEYTEDRRCACQLLLKQDAKPWVAFDALKCMTHKVLPHFLRPVYVGNESAQEVVEAWHLEMSKLKRDI